MSHKLFVWRDWSIATKLAFFFIASILIALVSFALVEDARDRGTVPAQARERNLQRARATAQLLDFYLASVDANVQLIAVAPGTVDFMDGVQYEIHREHIALALEFARARGGYDAVFLLNPLGEVLIATDERLVGRNYTTATWFRNATAGRTMFDEPRYDAVDGKVYLHISAPVTTPRGQVVGVVVARLTLGPIDNIIAADVNYDGRGASGVLQDENGIRLSHSIRQDLRFKPMAPLPTGLLNEMVYEARYGPDTAAILGNPTDFNELVRRGKQLFFDSQTDPYLSVNSIPAGPVDLALAPLKNKRWIYSIGTPQANLLAEVNQQTKTSLLQALGIGLLALMVSFIGASWITRPIRRVSEAANALASGDRRRRLRMRQRDEVGQLAAAFDTMADTLAEKEDQLRDYATQLEAKVEKRTQEIKQRLTELEAVYKISTSLRAAQTLDDMLPLLLDETLSALQTTAGSIYLYNLEDNELRPAMSRGWFEQVKPALKPNEGIGGRVFATTAPLITREFSRDPIVQDSVRSLLPTGWGGAVVPIRSERETLGVFFVSVQLPREITPQDIHLLLTIAEIAGNAIQRTRSHEQTVIHLNHLASLRAIDNIIMSSTDLKLTLSALLQEILPQLQVDAADILIFHKDSQTLEYKEGTGFGTSSLKNMRWRLGESLAARMALERRTVVIPDLQHAGARAASPPLNAKLKAAIQHENFVCYYGVPLIAKGELKGVLEIFSRAPLTPSRDWLGFLETLAGQAAIAIDNITLFEGLYRLNLELSIAYDATIEGWSRAIDLRDKETEGHMLRVTEMTLTLARAMGVSEEDILHVRRGALLHDIGKMGIPDGILLKPDKLSEEEWMVMRKHPQYAYDLLVPIAYLRPALDIPYCHHEKWDGTGYPRGLKGEAIPLSARLFAVADVWDALSSNRPYRQAWAKEKVIEHIKAGAGSHFDPKVVEVFLRIINVYQEL